MKSKLVFILVLFSLSRAWAGWVTQESGTTQDLNALYFVTNATGFAVGGSGTILKTTNGGTTWESKSTGAANYNDILFPKYAEGYVLGPGGKFLKSTDGGENFAQFDLSGFPQLAAANFKKGSCLSQNRSVAASTGSASDSYLLASSNEGASWTASPLANLDLEGTLLSSGEGDAVVTWIWGKYFAGDDANKYVILKNGIAVWKDSSRAVRDVFFYDKDYGFAVGGSGLILKTTAGGDLGEWSEITGITSQNLKAVWFILPNFGWIVGEQGTIYLTADSGTIWNSYALNSTVSINDLSVRATIVGTKANVYAFLAGSSGKIFKLASPIIKSIYPTSRNRGWVGTLVITGEGFLEGASISFSKAGSAGAGISSGAVLSLVAAAATDTGITVASTSVESSSLAKSTILIDISTEAKSLDLEFLNLDATSTKEAGAFNITTGEAKVTFSGIWIDGNKYLPPSSESPNTPKTTVTQQPQVSFEVVSAGSASAGGISASDLSKGTLNGRIITEYDGKYIFSNILESNMTIISTNQIQISYKVPEILPKGVVVNFMLYAEDTKGNVGVDSLKVAVAQDVAEGQPAWNPPPVPGSFQPDKPEEPSAAVFPSKNTWDYETETSLPAEIRLTPGTSVQSLTLKVIDFTGKLVCSKQLQSPSGFVGKINLNLLQSEFAPYCGAGIYTILVFNDATGKLLAKNLIVIAPKNMTQ